MTRYKNLGGDSAVVAFQIEGDSITVQFKDGKTYLYNVASTGISNIREMQKMAIAGHGLNSFISRVVKKKFSRKW